MASRRSLASLHPRRPALERWGLLGALAFTACGQAAPVATGAGGSGVGGGGAGGGEAGGGEAGGGVQGGGGYGGYGGSAGSGAGGAAPLGLLGAPVVFSPTTHGFGISVVLSGGDPATLWARVRPKGQTVWGGPAVPVVRATDLAEWDVEGLTPGGAYEYQIAGIAASGDEVALYQGSVVTQRPPGASFSFALVTDTHIGSDLTFSNQGDVATLSTVSGAIGLAAPDFVVNLGDMLDFHEYGFNVPPPDGSITRLAYLNYRQGLGDAVANAAHFPVIGGWDSESGCNTLEEINRSRDQRLLYLPGPGPGTYPEGGSPFEDYYAFTWGDALFVVLNVFTYTPTCHLLDNYPGLPDDWTLGDTQLAWLRTTLENATSKWRFLLIHHPVGGNGGDAVDSAYGRGGGRAANVGEQAVVHQLMQEQGVQIFFYGHDHVFTDMTVDKTHYSLPGSAGAIWFFTPDETGYTQDWGVPGWGRVNVTPDGVHVQFLDLTGQILYEYDVK
jgi:hypothetical protein